MTLSMHIRRAPARLALAGLLIAASATLAAAQTHVRGEVTAIDGDTASVETTDGERVDVTLAPDFGLMVFTGIDVEDLSPGDYLSIPSVTAADGAKQALAVNVFPATMKGTGEGVTDWDLGADSLMTNATLGTLAASGADHSIVVSYGGQEETISVPETTPITRFGPEPGRTLAVGDNVVFFGEVADGKYSAGRAAVAADGALPPI